MNIRLEIIQNALYFSEYGSIPYTYTSNGQTMYSSLHYSTDLGSLKIKCDDDHIFDIRPYKIEQTIAGSKTFLPFYINFLYNAIQER